MGLYRRNSLILLLIIFTLVSCGSRKTKDTSVIETDRTERSVVENPFKVASSNKLRVGADGKIEPTKITLYHNHTSSNVEIKDNELTSVMESKDTVYIEKVVYVSKKETKEKVIEVKPKVVKPKKKTFWQSIQAFGNKILFFSLLANALFIGYRIYKVKRAILPI